MLVKLSFPALSCDYPDVDMLRCKEISSYTECVVPRRPKRTLPPLPEDSEYDESKRPNKMHRKRKYRKQCLKLPALPEYDEY